MVVDHGKHIFSHGQGIILHHQRLCLFPGSLLHTILFMALNKFSIKPGLPSTALYHLDDWMWLAGTKTNFSDIIICRWGINVKRRRKDYKPGDYFDFFFFFWDILHFK